MCAKGVGIMQLTSAAVAMRCKKNPFQLVGTFRPLLWMLHALVLNISSKGISQEPVWILPLKKTRAKPVGTPPEEGHSGSPHGLLVLREDRVIL